MFSPFACLRIFLLLTPGPLREHPGHSPRPGFGVCVLPPSPGAGFGGGGDSLTGRKRRSPSITHRHPHHIKQTTTSSSSDDDDSVLEVTSTTNTSAVDPQLDCCQLLWSPVRLPAAAELRQLRRRKRLRRWSTSSSGSNDSNGPEYNPESAGPHQSGFRDGGDDDSDDYDDDEVGLPVLVPLSHCFLDLVHERRIKALHACILSERCLQVCFCHGFTFFGATSWDGSFSGDFGHPRIWDN